MTVWAIADLHLSFGVPEKSMEVFGPEWLDYSNKLKSNWEEVVKPDDLVLLAGDISWAMRASEAQVDLEWIEKLPGVKVMIKGNHDYWWSSVSKVREMLPPSLHIIQNDAFTWKEYTIGGARLWDTTEYDFHSYIDFKENPVSTSKEEKPDPEKIFVRELERLELSLRKLDPNASHRIVMTHYPPIGADLAPSRVSALLEKYRVEVCLFGHLHSVGGGKLPFGERGGVRYYLTSCDYLDFRPLKIVFE